MLGSQYPFYFSFSLEEAPMFTELLSTRNNYGWPKRKLMQAALKISVWILFNGKERIGSHMFICPFHGTTERYKTKVFAKWILLLTAWITFHTLKHTETPNLVLIHILIFVYGCGIQLVSGCLQSYFIDVAFFLKKYFWGILFLIVMVGRDRNYREREVMTGCKRCQIRTQADVVRP